MMALHTNGRNLELDDMATDKRSGKFGGPTKRDSSSEIQVCAVINSLATGLFQSRWFCHLVESKRSS